MLHQYIHLFLPFLQTPSGSSRSRIASSESIRIRSVPPAATSIILRYAIHFRTHDEILIFLRHFRWKCFNFLCFCNSFWVKICHMHSPFCDVMLQKEEFLLRLFYHRRRTIESHEIYKILLLSIIKTLLFYSFTSFVTFWFFFHLLVVA